MSRLEARLGVVTLIPGSLTARGPAPPRRQRHGAWSDCGGAADSMRYAALEQAWGAIQWQAGVVPSPAARGVNDPGGCQPTRNGPVVTAGGLNFIGALPPAHPEGIPAVYEAAGGQDVVFNAGASRVFDNIRQYRGPGRSPGSREGRKRPDITCSRRPPERGKRREVSRQFESNLREGS